jgi:hypothetical protein
MNEEIPFSLEDAAFLMTASQPFEAWVNKVVFDWNPLPRILHCSREKV